MISEKRSHPLNLILRTLTLSISISVGPCSPGLLWITQLSWPHLHTHIQCQCQCLQGLFPCIRICSHTTFMEIRIQGSFLILVRLLFHLYLPVPWWNSSQPNIYLHLCSLEVDPMPQGKKVPETSHQDRARMRKMRIQIILRQTWN